MTVARTWLAAIDPDKFVSRGAAFEQRVRDLGVGRRGSAVPVGLTRVRGLDVAVAVALPGDEGGAAVEQVVFARAGVGVAGEEADGQDDEGGGLHGCCWGKCFGVVVVFVVGISCCWKLLFGELMLMVVETWD